MADLYRERTFRARKKHLCDLCDRPILPRREYVRGSWKDGDGFHELKYHAHCNALVNAYCSRSTELEYTIDDVQDFCIELCRDAHEAGECPEEVFYEECDGQRVFACPKVFARAIPDDPDALRRMTDDVRANEEGQDT